MKRIFTLLLIFSATFSFAQKGSTISEQEFTNSTNRVVNQSKSVASDVVLPGDWANVTEVGMYRWVDGETPLGWIFGNNSYGAYGAGSKFSTDVEIEVVGAYFWIGSKSTGTTEIKFCVYEFADGAVGSEVACKIQTLDDITVLETTDATPDQYTDAFYVEFDEPVLVSGDYFIGVDASAVTWAAHGDGIGMVTGKIDAGGGGTGTAFIVDATDGWTTAASWNEAVDLDLGVFPVVQEPSTTEDYAVTFNVDMTGVEGFDPATHKVILTGSMTGWATPGTEGSIEMTKVTSKEDVPTTLTESFEGFADFTTDLTPWTTIQLTEGDTYGSNGFDFTNEATAFAFMAFNPSATDPAINGDFPAQDGAKYAVAIQYTGTDDDKWLISPKMMGTATSMLSFYAKSYTDEYGLERFQVMISTTDAEPASFTKISDGDYIEAPLDWTKYDYDLSEYDAQEFYFAIHYVSYDAFIFMLDNINVTSESQSDELIYTATVDVEAGEIQYKYFSDFVGEGWDGGEWAGDPNRTATVAGEMTINNVWGEITSADEITAEGSTTLFPNPASSELNVEHATRISEIRVFDITGRMVYTSPVNNLTNTKVDVSNFSNGVYIL